MFPRQALASSIANQGWQPLGVGKQTLAWHENEASGPKPSDNQRADDKEAFWSGWPCQQLGVFLAKPRAAWPLIRK
jgi:hypothetical protein